MAIKQEQVFASLTWASYQMLLRAIDYVLKANQCGCMQYIFRYF